jgi:AraC-like DNA-binding protein
MGAESRLLARTAKKDLRDRSWSRSVATIGGQVLPGRENKTAVPDPHALEPSSPAEQEVSEWNRLLGALLGLAPKTSSKPQWWDAEMSFRASLQTWTTAGLRSLAGLSSPPVVSSPATTLQITLAGWGHYRGDDGVPQICGPGTVLFGSSEALATSLSLPKESQEWTFARLEITHPYLHQRIAEKTQQLGQAFDVQPDDALTASLLRLVRAEILKGFNEPADAERTLFDFVLSFEQWARRKVDGTREIERLISDTRSYVLAKLPQAIDVESLAARFGMSRCHFSHHFRRMTGMTPGHFATEVRLHKVEELLLDTREPLKCIADACGFANPNHLCKVFRRLRHVTPTVFRQRKR